MADLEPVWQPQYGSGVEYEPSPRGHPSVNGARYVDDGYGREFELSGRADLEPGFTQQQVNGSCFIVVPAYNIESDRRGESG